MSGAYRRAIKQSKRMNAFFFILTETKWANNWGNKTTLVIMNKLRDQKNRNHSSMTKTNHLYIEFADNVKFSWPVYMTESRHMFSKNLSFAKAKNYQIGRLIGGMKFHQIEKRE